MFFKGKLALCLCFNSCMSSNELRINSCIDKSFDKIMAENNELDELKIARFLPIIGFVLELIIEIAGIFIVYFVLKLLAPFVAGGDFNNNYLYSMLLIPIVYSLKKMPEIFKSVFVRIAISKEFIICKRGYFRRFVDKLYVAHIDNVEMRTTIWGEWFNYGTIDLYSFGGKISLPFVKNCCDLFFDLEKMIAESRKSIN